MKKLFAAGALALTLALVPAIAFANALAMPLHSEETPFSQVAPRAALERLAPLYALMQQPKTTAPAACPADGVDCPRHGDACPNAACPANGLNCPRHGDACPNAACPNAACPADGLSCQRHGDACPNASGRDYRGGTFDNGGSARGGHHSWGHHGNGHGCR